MATAAYRHIRTAGLNIDVLEQFNGRAAMLGIVIGILTEAVTGSGIAHQIGLGALIADFVNAVDVYVAEANAAEAAGYIGELATRRGLDPQICQEAFLSLMEVVQVVDTPLIEGAKDEALKRIRDPADWPALALALQLECAEGSIVSR